MSIFLRCDHISEVLTKKNLVNSESLKHKLLVNAANPCDQFKLSGEIFQPHLYLKEKCENSPSSGKFDRAFTADVIVLNLCPILLRCVNVLNASLNNIDKVGVSLI